MGWSADELGRVWAPYFASHTFAAYEAIAQVPGKPRSDQALLLADDERRYVFASTGAERLFGRPAARILGCRIDDLTSPELRGRLPDLWQTFVREGSHAADFSLARPDGSLVDVHYEARAHTPWHGGHAAVLGEPGADVDFDGSSPRRASSRGVRSRRR